MVASELITHTGNTCNIITEAPGPSHEWHCSHADISVMLTFAMVGGTKDMAESSHHIQN